MSKWKNPEEVLPKPGRAVLVWVAENNCQYAAYYYDGKWMCWSPVGMGGGEFPFRVDQWRKLPNTPDYVNVSECEDVDVDTDPKNEILYHMDLANQIYGDANIRLILKFILEKMNGKL